MIWLAEFLSEVAEEARKEAGMCDPEGDLGVELAGRLGVRPSSPVKSRISPSNELGFSPLSPLTAGQRRG